MLAILASPFAYDLQRIGDTVPTPDSFILSVYLFEDEMLLTTLFQFPTFDSTSWLTLPQTVVLYLTQHFLATRTTSTHCP